MFNKDYYDSIKTLAGHNNISYNDAKEIIDSKIAEYIHKKNEENKFFILDNISDYAYVSYGKHKYTEIIAECNTKCDNKEARDILALLNIER